MNREKLLNLTNELNAESFKEQLEPLEFKAGDIIEVSINGAVIRGKCIFIRKRGILTKIGVLIVSQNNINSYQTSFYVYMKNVSVRLIRKTPARRAKCYNGN